MNDIKATLQKFCAEDDNNYTGKLITIDGYTYATDGHICLRIQGEYGIKPNTDFNPGKSIKWEAFDSISGINAEIITLEDVLKYKIPCEYCDPDYVITYDVTCEECKGTGEVSWDSDFHRYSCTCESCNGLGEIVPDNKNGKYPINACPKCYGFGWSNKDGFPVWQIDSEYLNAGLLEKILTNLKEVKFYPGIYPKRSDGHIPTIFTFKNGQGLIMPMDVKHSDFKVVNQ